MRVRFLASLIPWVAFVVAGCESPQSGGQIGGETNPCVPVVTTPLGPDEVSPFGFTPNQLVVNVSGTRTASFAWAKGGSTELTVGVTAAIESAAFVDYEYESNDGTEPEIACMDAVEIAAAVTFTTADGAFAETLSLTLSATDADRGVIAEELQLEALTGTYEVTEVDPAEYESLAVFLGAEITATAISGEVTGQAVAACTGDDPDDSCSAEMFEVGTFSGP